MVVDLNSKLKMMRKQRGLTQLELAKKLGVSESYVCQIENGKMISIKKLNELAKALGCEAKFVLNILFRKGRFMFTKNDIVTIIQDNMEEIRSYGIKKIGIFGSAVNASQNEESDIDILVEFQRGKKTFDNYIGLKFFLEKLFNRKVDLVLEDVLKSRIKDSVLKEVSYARL